MEKVTFKEFCRIMTASLEAGEPKAGVIVFASESFKQEYPLENRSYRVSSYSKYFDRTKIGNSLLGFCLDKTDPDSLGVRLDWYLDSWKVEYCYFN